ncbi:uncharacterized protein HMPREF1541_02717 [Cyphellophora europaea CBS 101466]|uniref:Uncharacterized protein n=1 Tax=Cyphellophora europaea (strain CBS 101466) TaxID=1220924 RepID=W2S6A0_CYPE1|nr:uncharacterized protein HMPREF1541_02717 [Cyphellophora europaea CBS 101466]ETN43558.1 hypothetical protein HMPREF1541_02717 [Cyphellophora europaea CBS 101466]
MAATHGPLAANVRPAPKSSLVTERRSLDSARPHILPKDIKLPPSPPGEEEDAFGNSSPRPTASSPGIVFPPTTAINTLSSSASVSLPYRPRTQSPSRPAMRPHTATGAPMMQRAHSSPGVDSSGRFVTPSFVTPRRPTSPLNGGRRRSPLRPSVEDSYNSWSGLSIEPNIPENEELEITFDSDYQTSPVPSYSNTFPRSRRRPTSPLHQSASAPSLYARGGSPGHSRSVSPSFVASKYMTEPYPTYYSSASSVPSTPTSIRSRSPSISSLETIEDTPDAEEQAMLDEEDARRSEDGDGADMRRRSSLEIRASNLRSNKERKRWSVCGAERRADFSLEPIEE